MAEKTLLDSDPAPTRRDETGTVTSPAATLIDGAPAATRLDNGAAGTRRDEAPPGPRRSIFNLPQALETRFRVVEALPTAGAEAELLIVEATESRQRVVAKLYRPGIRPKTEVLERIADIAPQHVVKLIEHGQSDGLWYELLEYCRFGSLRRFLRGRAIPGRYVERIFTEVFRAVSHLHESGIIHRDLKPENVLIRATDPLDLVLTDFGISSLAEASQHFTSASRTVKYGAPEAASGVISAKADYWSLGMMVLEALSGRHPFEGLSEPVINQRLATRPIDVSSVTEERWRLLCRGLLHRNPEERWGGERVERWLKGERTLATAVDDAAPVDAGAVSPYTIENDSCTTAAELGVALARHWRTGVKDLARGFISSWVQRELKDLNLSRFLHDLVEESRLTPDMRLLRLILRLAPGLPPIWRGEPLERENLLAMAVKASGGDAAATQWLKGLVDENVLSAYGAAGVTQLQDMDGAWSEKTAEVQKHLHRLLAAEKEMADEMAKIENIDDRPPDMDALMFGAGRINRPTVPHAEVLQLLLTDNYGPVVRARVLAQIAAAGTDCPWFHVLGAVEKLDGAQLVAMKAAFPNAQIWVKEARDRRIRREQLENLRIAELQSRLDRLLWGIRDLREADFSDMGFNGRGLSNIYVLQERITQFRELDADAANLSANTVEAQSFRNMLSRVRFTINSIERQLSNARSWVTRSSTASGVLFPISIILTMIFSSFWLFGLGILLIVGSFAWFGWLRLRANGELRRLLGRLPRPTSTAATIENVLNGGRAA